jgi:hypothetical protein
MWSHPLGVLITKTQKLLRISPLPWTFCFSLSSFSSPSTWSSPCHHHHHDLHLLHHLECVTYLIITRAIGLALMFHQFAKIKLELSTLYNPPSRPYRRSQALSFFLSFFCVAGRHHFGLWREGGRSWGNGMWAPVEDGVVDWCSVACIGWQEAGLNRQVGTNCRWIGF